eukprot:scaffold1079_cov191-Amphora_coffeaeformis.AAC.10
MAGPSLNNFIEEGWAGYQYYDMTAPDRLNSSLVSTLERKPTNVLLRMNLEGAIIAHRCNPRALPEG